MLWYVLLCEGILRSRTWVLIFVRSFYSLCLQAVHSSRTLSTDSADVMESSMSHCLLQMDKLIRYKRGSCYSLHRCVMNVPVRQIFLQDILMDEVEIITSEGSTSQQGQIVRLHLGPLYTLSTAIPDGCNAVCHS